MRMYFFYILYSDTLSKYYYGSSSCMEERLKKHNTHHKGFTGKANDWRLVYSEGYSEKLLALKREQEVKNWKSRKRVEELIRRI